jgi:hypothetical protein
MNSRSAGMSILKKGLAISGVVARLLIGIGSAAILLVSALSFRKKKH